MGGAVRYHGIDFALRQVTQLSYLYGYNHVHQRNTQTVQGQAGFL
jgi:hypothetical protein